MREVREFLSEVTQRLELMLQEMPPGQLEQVEAVLLESNCVNTAFCSVTGRSLGGDETLGPQDLREHHFGYHDSAQKDIKDWVYWFYDRDTIPSIADMVFGVLEAEVGQNWEYGTPEQQYQRWRDVVLAAV